MGMQLLELEEKRTIENSQGIQTIGIDAVDIEQWSPVNLDRLANLVLEARVGGRAYALGRARHNKETNINLTQSPGTQGVAIDVTAAFNAARMAQLQASTGSGNNKSNNGGTGKTQGRPVAKTVPEGILPGLAKLLVASQAMGIATVTAQFLAKHPSISKRQVELKIAELAVKEKHEKDHTKVWHIRPDFHYLLEIEDYDEEAEMEAASSIAAQGDTAANATDATASDALVSDVKVAPLEPFQQFSTEIYEKLITTCKTVNELKISLIKAWDELKDEGKLRYTKAYNEEMKAYEASSLKQEPLSEQEQEQKQSPTLTPATSTSEHESTSDAMSVVEPDSVAVAVTDVKEEAA